MKPTGPNSKTVCITNRRPLSTATGMEVRSGAAPASNWLQQSNSDQALEALRASQKLIELGRLSASIAHEINNPLSSIVNLLYLLRREPGMPDAADKYLNLIGHEMDRVIAISKQTLQFSRESGEPDSVQLAALLDEVLFLYRDGIDEKHMTVDCRYSLSDAAWGFPGELRQVFSNLISNAIEASYAGGRLQLRVRMATNAQGDRGLRVTVADNGTGIPPETVARLGELFFTTKGQQGTGLGLWVTRSIVERHGGELRLRSRCGERLHGTVFALFLPLTAPAAGATGPKLVPRSGQGSGRREKQHHRHDSFSHLRRVAGDD